MRSAGFVDIVAADWTNEYRATQRRWIGAAARHEQPLRASMGDELFDERVTYRRRTLAALDEGLLARYLYSARSIHFSGSAIAANPTLR